MDVELFKSRFGGNRMKAMIDYSIASGWMTYDELFAVGQKNSLKKNPSDTRHAIKRLIIYGFLEAHPKKGLRYNKSFIPIDQRPLLKTV